MNYFFKNVLIVSDNQSILEQVYNVLLERKIIEHVHFSFTCSPETVINSTILPSVQYIDVKRDIYEILEKHDLVLSIHSKQIFPAELTKSVRCINIHPGFNPYNRGMYPHIFSIINKLPTGVTIHEMDEELDNGPIIAQQEVQIFPYDTSKELYGRIVGAEVKLFSELIENILNNSYNVSNKKHEGNINTRKDFERMRMIDLKKMYSGKEFIDLLRALTHGDYQNAYFYDESGKKIYVKLFLEEEKTRREFA